MADLEISKEVPIAMAELNEELNKIKKKDKELNFRANKTQEYLSQFVKLNWKKTQELIGKLNKLKIPRLKENHIIKIVDVLPTTQEDVKILLQAYTVTVTNDNLKKIANTVKEAVK